MDNYYLGKQAARIDHNESWISPNDTVDDIINSARAQVGGGSDYWVGYRVQLRQLGYS